MLLGDVFHQKHTFQLHECVPFPAAPRHQTLQEPSPGPSKQILAQGENSASLALAARPVEGQGMEGLLKEAYFRGFKPARSRRQARAVRAMRQNVFRWTRAWHRPSLAPLRHRQRGAMWPAALDLVSATEAGKG